MLFEKFKITLLNGKKILKKYDCFSSYEKKLTKFNQVF